MKPVYKLTKEATDFVDKIMEYHCSDYRAMVNKYPHHRGKGLPILVSFEESPYEYSHFGFIVKDLTHDNGTVEPDWWTRDNLVECLEDLLGVK